MTIKFSINTDNKLMTVNLSEQITDTELINSFKSYYDNNKNKANFDQLILFEETADFDLETESFIQLSKMADDFLKHNEEAIKTAFVIDKTMHKIITDTYRSISSAFGTSASRQTFRDLASALNWLGAVSN